MKFALASIAAPCLLIALFNSGALAAPYSQGWGRVNMQGAIIDTACAIAAGSRDQTIDMDVVPVSDIMRDGQGKTRPFDIELINCTLQRADKKLPDWKQFQVTFDGDVEGDLFGVHGDAQGVGLRIADKQGNIARPGNPLPLEDISPGPMLLNYSMTLVSNKQPLKAGNYFSAVRFKLDYY